jgi:hypothetical protein
MVSRFACGMSQQMKSTLPSIRLAINATLRANRSSFAMTSFALCFLQAARALSSSGRSSRLPLAALHLDKFAEQLPVAAIEVTCYSRALGIDAVAGLPSSVC